MHLSPLASIAEIWYYTQILLRKGSWMGFSFKSVLLAVISLLLYDFMSTDNHDFTDWKWFSSLILTYLRFWNLFENWNFDPLKYVHEIAPDFSHDVLIFSSAKALDIDSIDKFNKKWRHLECDILEFLVPENIEKENCHKFYVKIFKGSKFSSSNEFQHRNVFREITL